MAVKNLGGDSYEAVVVVDGNGNTSSATAAPGSSVTSVTPSGYTDSSGNASGVSDSNPFPVIFNQPRGTLTDRSGAITTGGTSQTLMVANPSRKYLLVVNPTVATENIYINFTGNATVATSQTAATSSIPIAPGGSYSPTGYVPTEAINIIAATTAHAFVAKEG